MNTKQKYEFTDWMIHAVIPERLELLNGEFRDGSNTLDVIVAQAVELRAIPTIDSAAAWNMARPLILRDLSDLRALRALSDLSDLSDLSALRALSDLSALRALSALSEFGAKVEALYRGHITTAIERGFLSVPVVPKIDATILAAIEAPGADGFNMSDWHRHNCQTTHCRAGWAVVMAGNPGLELEKQFTTPTAAALIYIASRPNQPIPNFYDSTESAMADLRKCAAEQLAG